MASSSSLFKQPPRKYEVFLSFRGEDTRNSFVSHLHTGLHQRGIVTFFDEVNLEKGQSISPELLKSIEDSKFAIIVFSKNYASSTWCLDELVKIMDCRSKYGQIVIPIFYDVDPSDVRKQSNSFAESFAKHEVKFKDNLEKVQIWKENLIEAANLAGHDLSRRIVAEAQCINKIVEEIFNKLPRKSSVKGLVGMEDRVKKLSSLLARKPNDVCFAGIWGMGGIGKTTTAGAIYDELIDGFEGGCFLRDVCKHDMVDLQKILLSKVLRLEHVNISDEYEGSNMISNHLSFKRVLLVLDDVNDRNQLNLLAGEREWFGNGSMIIITTRDKRLLSEVNELYQIHTLSYLESLQLFCWHAFKKSHPDEGFVQLSYRVVSYAGGLPLALEVLGSLLLGRQEEVWKSTLDMLKDAPEDKISTVLKISYDGLNGNQQNIFLDIACFFRSKRADEVEEMLHSCGFHPVGGITVLVEKSLINISEGRIKMHDLVQEMGWNIVRQKANNEPGIYSRLWNSEDIIDVLRNNTKSVSNMLCRRQELLHVTLPWTDQLPDWLYQSGTGSLVTINLSPLSFNNELLRGIVLFVRCGEYTTISIAGHDVERYEYQLYPSMVFLYIPIDKVSRDRLLKGEKECCLFEARYDAETTWGIRLVYEGGVDRMNMSYLRIDNYLGPVTRYNGSIMKISVMPLSQIQ